MKTSLFVPFLAAGLLQAAAPTWETLEELGRWKQLRTQVDKACQADPGSARNLRWKARVCMAFGQGKEAYELAKKAAALAPRDADAQCMLGMAAMGLIPSVQPLQKLSLSGEGRKACEAALAIDGRHAVALTFLAGFYAQAPALVGGDPARSEALVKVLMGVDPARAWGFQASQAKDPARMEECHRMALAADPKNVLAHAYLAALQLGRQPAEALKHAQEAVRLDPQRVEGHTVLARACAELERWQELDAALDAAARAVPDNPKPYLAAAERLIQKFKDFPRAERYLRKYLAQEAEGGAPGHAVAHAKLALVCEKLNRKAEAAAELEAAARLAPDNDSYRQELRRLRS